MKRLLSTIWQNLHHQFKFLLQTKRFLSESSDVLLFLKLPIIISGRNEKIAKYNLEEFTPSIQILIPNGTFSFRII